MKDIVITNAKLKRELIIFLVCFALAFAVNIGAIIAYSRPWNEVYSQIGYVIAISVLFYFVFLIIRAIVKGLIILFSRNIKH